MSCTTVKKKKKNVYTDSSEQNCAWEHYIFKIFDNLMKNVSSLLTYFSYVIPLRFVPNPASRAILDSMWTDMTSRTTLPRDSRLIASEISLAAGGRQFVQAPIQLPCNLTAWADKSAGWCKDTDLDLVPRDEDTRPKISYYSWPYGSRVPIQYKGAVLPV